MAEKWYSRADGMPAGNLQRFFASMLDGFILIAISAPVPALLGDNTDLTLLTVLLMQIAYFSYFQSSERQATPGKRICGIYVTDKFGARLSLRRSLERTLALLIPFLPQASTLPDETAGTLALWLVLIWFTPIFYTTARTGVHDMLCGTRVVTGRVGG